MDDDNNRQINVNQYNSDEGKLISSIKWLITRIYEDNGIPDKLRELFYRDNEGNLNLTTAVATALTNGSLYSQAASRILKEPGLVNQSHGTVLRALSHAVEIEVRDSDGALVTEMALISTDPIKLTTHLALIDALMTAHMKSIITIERVVNAVSEYTIVENREEPMDCIDSLLFWINKICLLVRDDVERNDILLKDSEDINNVTTIPEMEDLYEDLCDGTCISALISFYRPHELQLNDICFNDPISLQDCRYNLGLLKNFCEICLPWNPFHFEIDDILYLHESLQPNVNAFLADLFYFFEPSQLESHQQAQQQQELQSPTQRRFIPINAIPELRAQNLANRPMHPPKVRNNLNHQQNHLAVDRNRTLSLSSQDSLMTSKSGDRQQSNNAYRPTTLPPGAPTMSFGALGNDLLTSPNGLNNGEQKLINNDHGNGKSDSTSLTAIRLAMHQRRQEYEQKQYMENSATEAERQKAGKDAFFKVMKPTSATSTTTIMGQDLQQRIRAQSEMAPQAMVLPPTPGGTSTMLGGNEQHQNFPTREDVLSAQVQSLQEQIQNMAFNNAMNRPATGMSHAISQPSIHNDLMNAAGPMYRPPMQQQQPDPHQMYAMPYGYQPPSQMSHNSSLPYDQQQLQQQQPNYAMPQMQQQQLPPPSSYYSPMRYGNTQTLPHINNSGGGVMSYSMYEQQHPNNNISPQQNNIYGGNSFDDYSIHQHQLQQQQTMIPNANNPNTFHLHQANASNSRLDPPLELNRNLTNWGLTYRSQNRTPRKTWAEFKSEHDLRNPNFDHSSQSGGNGGGGFHDNNISSQHTPPSSQSSRVATTATTYDFQQQQNSPPRDPDLRPSLLQMSQSTTSMMMQNQDTTPQRRRHPSLPKYENGSAAASLEKPPATGFIIKDNNGSPTVDMTPEMQAKKNALYANLMKRKEQIADKVEEKEAQFAGKRQAEIAKQEAAEQRKIEKEFRRQKLLEEYKRKKFEKEFPDLIYASTSSNSPMMSARSNSNLQRGHSQPPFVSMGKSQSNMHEVTMRSTPRASRAKSNAGDENSTPRLNIPSTAEPSLKLFSKHVPKSNRSLIVNALQYSIFPGAVSSDQRNKVQEALAQADSKHFLLLFRDHKCQYRGLYTWDGAADTAHKVHGMGPRIVSEDMMNMMYKYDSGSKKFNKIPAKHLSPTIDGFTIHDQLWQKPKIPHSGGSR